MVVDGAFNGRDVLNQDNVMWSSLIAIDSLASNHMLENPTHDGVNTWKLIFESADTHWKSLAASQPDALARKLDTLGATIATRVLERFKQHHASAKELASVDACVNKVEKPKADIPTPREEKSEEN